MLHGGKLIYLNKWIGIGKSTSPPSFMKEQGQMKFPDEMNCRENPMSPLTLLTEAEVRINSLANTYPMLAAHKDVQQIYALLDGAIFKLQTLKEKVESSKILDEAEILKTSDVPINENEKVDEKPMTASELARGIFDYFTSD